MFNVEEEESEEILNKIERDIPILIDQHEKKTLENREKRKFKRRPASLPLIQVSNKEPIQIELSSSFKKKQHYINNQNKKNEIKTIPDHIFFDENDLILNKNESKLINLISTLDEEMKLIINGKINNCIKNSKVRSKITSFMILKNDDTNNNTTQEANQTFNFIDEYDTYDIKSLTDSIVISNEQFSTYLTDFETELIYIVSIFNYLNNKNPPITYIISKKLIETSILSSPITNTINGDKSLNCFDKLKLYFNNINTSSEIKSGYHYSIDIDLSLSNPKKCKK
jgi:hypothetical protein